MVGREEGFLAVEDGGIGACGVVVAVDLPRPERDLDAAEQGRVRVGGEVGMNEIRHFPRTPVQLDQVRPLDLAQVRPMFSCLKCHHLHIKCPSNIAYAAPRQ